MKQLIMWAYSKRELSEFKLGFEDAFKIQLIRDCENVWEWLWNGDKE